MTGGCELRGCPAFCPRCGCAPLLRWGVRGRGVRRCRATRSEPVAGPRGGAALSLLLWPLQSARGCLVAVLVSVGGLARAGLCRVCCVLGSLGLSAVAYVFGLALYGRSVDVLFLGVARRGVRRLPALPVSRLACAYSLVVVFGAAALCSSCGTVHVCYRVFAAWSAVASVLPCRLSASLLVFAGGGSRSVSRRPVGAVPRSGSPF